jgi:hypothetical protein
LTSGRVGSLLATALLVLAVAYPCTARAAAEDQVRLLDVPYLPQSEALCGGAAAAMVMRYWTGSVVHADAFAGLVNEEAGGIRGDDLVRGLRDRGWQAVSFRGDPQVVAEHLANRRPLIVLIEDSPNRFHYLVVVGWWRDRVIAHDPARAPFRVYDATSFTAAWAKSGYWTLLATPPATTADSPPEGAASAPAAAPVAADGGGTTTCEAMVSEGVRLAGAGDLDRAAALLELAREMCGGDPAPLRELAGVHVVRKEWSLAAKLAADALRIDSSDAHSARILATSRFLLDDLDGALDAWNRIGEPVVDLVNVSGLERLRYEVAANLMELEPRDSLTSSTLALARRRLSELPAAALSSVTYAPGASGRANVEAAIVERPVFPSGVVPLGVIGARALTDREVSVTIAGVTGGGEALTASWRWWSRRPRIGLSFEAPSPSRHLGSVWRVDAFHDEQTYAPDREFKETWRAAKFSTADWLTPEWRAELGIGIDHFDKIGNSGSFAASLERRARDDDWRVITAVGVYAGNLTTATLSTHVDWRTPRRATGSAFLARGGFQVAGDEAPLALWPGAGTEPARDALLRAHPLLDDGVVTDAVIGRTLVSGSAEWRYWFQPGPRPFRIAPALFADAARAARSIDGFDQRFHVDVGIGLRLGMPGAGVLRVDLGRGLRDGEMALSLGWDLR